VTLTELAGIVARSLELDEGDVWVICTELAAVMTEVLEHGEEIKIRGLGSFTWRRHKASRRRHPLTKEMVDMPERDKLTFTPTEKLKWRS